MLSSASGFFAAIFLQLEVHLLATVVYLLFLVVLFFISSFS